MSMEKINIFTKKPSAKEEIRTSKREMSVATSCHKNFVSSTCQIETANSYSAREPCTNQRCCNTDTGRLENGTTFQAMYAYTSVAVGMKGASKAMAVMNKQLDPAKQAKVIKEFQKESTQMDMTEGEGYGAKLINVAVNQIGSQYFQSFIDFGELHKHKFLYPAWNYVREANVLAYSDLEVDSWLGFKFHEVDMGGGSPCAFMPSWIPEEGLIIIIAANSKEKHDKEQRWSSGINVIITLFREHADAFKKIAYSMD